MLIETRRATPTDGWPICHTGGGEAGIVTLRGSPGPHMSWYLDGFILSGGEPGDGFSILRRAALVFNADASTFTVTAADALVPGTDDFAIEFGLKAEESAVGEAENLDIILCVDGGGDGYSASIDEDGKLVAAAVGAEGAATVTSLNPINDGKWHHIVINIKAGVAGELQLFIDGIAVASVETGDLGDIVGTGEDLTIVGEDDKEFAISTLGLYKGKILSAEDIAARYASGAGSKFTGEEEGLSAAWNLDEGTGTDHADLVPDGANDGTSSGTVWAEGDGLPVDPHTLGRTIKFNIDGFVVTVGETEVNYVPNTVVTFPHPIKVGRNNPIRIDETEGGFGLMLFGHADSY